MMDKAFIQLTLLQIKEFYRYPEVIFWALIFPVATAMTLGFAFDSGFEAKKIITLVVPQQEAKLEVELLSQSLEKKSLAAKYIIKQTNRKEAMASYQAGKSVLVIEKNRKNDYDYFFHKSRTDSYQSYLELTSEPNQSNVKLFADQGFRYIDFLIPGLIAMGVMNSAIWGIGYALIEMRMKKTLRRLIITPMKRYQFMTSLIVTRIFVILIESLLLFFTIQFFFDLKPPSNPGLALATLITGTLAFGGIAVLMASRAQTTRSGNGLANAITLPMLILSGIFFSYNNFPDWLHPFLQALPLTIIADTFKSLFYETVNLADVYLGLFSLFTWFIVSLSAGLRFFRWS